MLADILIWAALAVAYIYMWIQADRLDGLRSDLDRLIRKVRKLEEMYLDHSHALPETPTVRWQHQPAYIRRPLAIEKGSELPEPCQPIGCDHGHHLPGCFYAAVDTEEIS